VHLKPTTEGNGGKMNEQMQRLRLVYIEMEYTVRGTKHVRVHNRQRAVCWTFTVVARNVSLSLVLW